MSTPDFENQLHAALSRIKTQLSSTESIKTPRASTHSDDYSSPSLVNTRKSYDKEIPADSHQVDSLHCARGDVLLEGLNPQQREAVVYSGGPLLVIAGAGSGKTRVLTTRIAYLLATGQAWASQILAITFTNKAAREMRERLEAMVGPEATHMWISTFHRACVRILRENHEAVGLRSSFTIYDAQDSAQLMKMVCEELSISKSLLTPKACAHIVSDWKNALITPEQASQQTQDQREEAAARAYQLYNERLRLAHACDFDDLIMRTVQLLETHEAVREHYRKRFRHILVDEYQDTNHAQYRLVRLLAGVPGEENNAELMVVGDADQSIYAFRGATIRNIEEFEEDFTHAHTIVLEQNYRSTQSILSAANAVIENNPHRRVKNLWTNEGMGEKIVGYVADSASDEAAFVMRTIDNLRESENVQYKDVAVFYRTNAQSRALEDACVRSGIPYRLIGGQRFYERKEIKDALAYLHVAVNVDDTVSLRRIINEPKRGIGAKAQEALAHHAAMNAISFGQALLDVAVESERGQVQGLSPKARKTLESLAHMFAQAREMAEEAHAERVLDFLLEESGYSGALRASQDPQDESRLENLAELHEVAADYSIENPDDTLAQWLERIALISDVDSLEDPHGEGYVTLMTVHTAKGLEFPVVFITGMEDGVFPHIRSLSDSGELAEERRLAYVAITRARRRLYVSRALSRSSWGESSFFAPSRFLEEIPSELIEWEREEPRYSRSGSRYSLSGSYSSESTPSWRHSSHMRRGETDWDDSIPTIGRGALARTERKSPTGFVPGKLGAQTGAKIGGVASTKAAQSHALRAGDTVEHATFGRGRVRSIEGRDAQKVAVVEFETGATKRLLLRYAPLIKVK